MKNTLKYLFAAVLTAILSLSLMSCDKTEESFDMTVSSLQGEWILDRTSDNTPATGYLTVTDNSYVMSYTIETGSNMYNYGDIEASNGNLYISVLKNIKFEQPDINTIVIHQGISKFYDYDYKWYFKRKQ